MRLVAVTLASALTATVAQTGHAQDASAWSGFNIGLQASKADGTQIYDPNISYDNQGNGFGVFGGYLFTSGPLAYGVEVAYTKTDYYQTDVNGPYRDYTFNHTLDLKLRGGYAVENALIYAVVGYNWAEWEEGAPNDTYRAKGPLFGLGLDYLVTDRVFLGAEALRRTLDTDYPHEVDVTTISLRVGMKF
jgi:outer membrane immunogenic protein